MHTHHTVVLQWLTRSIVCDFNTQKSLIVQTRVITGSTQASVFEVTEGRNFTEDFPDCVPSTETLSTQFGHRRGPYRQHSRNTAATNRKAGTLLIGDFLAF